MQVPPVDFRIESVEQVLGLPSVRYVDRWMLPQKPGLYFAIQEDGKVAYIGEAWVSIRRRVACHSKVRPLSEVCDLRIAYLICEDDGVRHRAEVFAIGHLQPRLNVAYMKRGRLKPGPRKRKPHAP